MRIKERTLATTTLTNPLALVTLGDMVAITVVR